MKNTYTFLILCMITMQASSQSWEKLFSARSTDVFRSVREAPAGGYICAGYTADSTVNDSDAYAVRLTTNGDTIWTYKYNGPSSRKDLFYKVLPTTDGGFIFIGYTTGNAGSDDLLILKLNSAGSMEWVRTWGGTQRERGQDIVQTTDGNYTIVGYTTSSPATYYDAFMVRVSSLGDILWTKFFGGGPGSYDDANAVRQLPDNGYIVGGQSSNGGNGLDQYLVRTDSSGNVIWQKRFGSMATDNIHSLALAPDGFILGGTTNDIATGDDGYLVKTDTAGNVVWAYSYGGAGPDDIHRAEMMASGDIVACGTTSSSGPLNPNIWLLKVSGTGTLVWQKTYGGDNHDHGYSAEETSDGGFIIAGHTGSFGYNFEEAYVIKTDGSGNVANKIVYTTVFGLVSPSTATCGSANTPVTVKLRNFSSASIPNIPVTVQVTGAATQPFYQTVSASTDTFTIGYLNTSAGGTYTFTCFTSNNNDVYPKRNILTVTITIPPSQSPPSVTGDQRCGNGTVTLNASAASTVYWFTVPNGGISIANGNSYTTPSLSNTTTYYAQTGITCPSARVPVVATVNSIPQTPVSSGASNCGPASLTINVTASDPVSWYTAASGGSPFTTGLSYTTPMLNTTTTYYIEASNGNCTSPRVAVVATISSLAADPITTAGSRCGPGTVVLIANSPDPVIWFDAPNGGAQVGMGLSFTTPSLTSTTTYYAQADNGCLSNRVSAVATVNAFAADPVVTAAERCGPGSVNLSATAADPVAWFDNAVAGTQIGTGNNFATPVLSSTTTYYVEAFNGFCPSNRIAVTATINQLPSVNLGNDTNLVSGIYIIDAGAGFVSYLWSDNSTLQTLFVSTTDNYCVTVTDANNCTNSDCVFIDFSIGITENEIHGLAVYPNPSNGNLTIEIPAGQSAQIVVSTLSGQVIHSLFTNQFINVIDIGSLSKGIYMLTVRNEKAVSHRRISLQ